jgi:murein DD-endopeptidase MepM/ murein hydrolase activator NlpD
MHVLITYGNLSRSKAMHLHPLKVTFIVAVLLVVLMALSGTIYHFIFLKAAREGWPVVSQIVRLVVRDEFAQRDRFVRENLDAMAQKVGEMQAKLVRLEAMGERVSGLAGLKPDDLRALEAPGGPASAPVPTGGRGGPYVPVNSPSMEQLNQWVAALEGNAATRADIFTLIESRLFEQKLTALMVPSSPPVNGPVGSGFGFRADPFTGRAALHTGLDFPSEPGTPILAAAGGVVITSDQHPSYGQMIEIDHGNGLVTRYAHTSKMLVKQGDLVKRGQQIALVGTTGRSTGPHLHFEVLVDGVQQDPEKFLSGRGAAQAAATGTRGR